LKRHAQGHIREKYPHGKQEQEAGDGNRMKIVKKKSFFARHVKGIILHFRIPHILKFDSLDLQETVQRIKNYTIPLPFFHDQNRESVISVSQQAVAAARGGKQQLFQGCVLHTF
jgi:hypothetical protein